MQAKLDKLQELREKRKNINIMDRIKPIIAELDHSQQSAAADGSAAAVKRNFQVYKRDIYYSYRSMSVVEKKDQLVQTEVMQKEVEMQRISLLKKGRSSLVQAVNPLINERPSQINTEPLIEDSKEESREQIEKLKSEIQTSHPPQKAELNPKDIEGITKNQKFKGFFFEASKFVEKALQSESGDSARPESAAPATGRDVETEVQFPLPAEMKGNIVNFVHWSPLIPEICLSVYMDRESMSPVKSSPDKIYIWNTAFNSRPEFELNSGAKISRAVFSPFNSEYVVSGLECGRLYLYDLRAKKDPVLKSLPLNESHKTSITGLDFIGGQNSNNVVSISEEGKLCLWTLSKLDYPVKNIEILPSDKKKDDEIAFPLEPFSLSIIPGDTSSIYLGMVDSNIYQCTVLGTNANDKLFEKCYKSHSAAVTSLHHNKSNSMSSVVSNAMLSGSLDWTIKLWSVKANEPLYTFMHHNNPITDVQWNPGHPAMFVSADSEGRVTVLDLYQDFDNPVWSSKEGNCILNAKWDQTGRFLALSDDTGVFKVKKFGAGLLNSKSGDISVFESSIQQSAIK